MQLFGPEEPHAFWSHLFLLSVFLVALRVIVMPRTKGARKGPRRALTRRPRSLLERIKQTSIGDAADAAYGAAMWAGKYIGLNEEVKFLDTSIVAGVTTYTGRVDPISLCPQGSTVSSRDGESVRCHGIELRYAVTVNGTATQNRARIIVFADSECRGATPAAADILELTAAANAELSPWNHLGKSRFNILFDKMLDVVTTGDPMVSATVILPFNEHIRYSGAAGAIANSYENNLFILSMGDVVTNGPLFNYYTRVHFVDN